jgi:hypothetical protein
MKNLLIPIPDCHYELLFFAADEEKKELQHVLFSMEHRPFPMVWCRQQEKLPQQTMLI